MLSLNNSSYDVHVVIMNTSDKSSLELYVVNLIVYGQETLVLLKKSENEFSVVRSSLAFPLSIV